MLENRKQRTNDVLIRNVFYTDKAHADGKLPSPIDLSLSMATSLRLEDDLEWRNLEKPPETMKLTNSGKSVVVTGQWLTDQRPTLAGGPLLDNYVLSQVHFHWGETDLEGSEHKVNGVSFPLEMHVLLHRTCYESQAAALACSDGVVVVVYLGCLAEQSCPGLKWISDHLPVVVQPHSSLELTPCPFSTLLIPFTDDYLAYRGAVSTDRCTHPLLWLLSRSPLAVSSKDLAVWRTLLDFERRPMRNTLGITYPVLGRAVYHINATLEEPYVSNDPPNHVSYFKSNSNFQRQQQEDNFNEMKILQPTTSLSDTNVLNSTRKNMEERNRSTGLTSAVSIPSVSPPSSPPIKARIKLAKENRNIVKFRNQPKNSVMGERRPLVLTKPFSIGMQPNKLNKKSNAEEAGKSELIHGEMSNVKESTEQIIPKPIIWDKTPSKLATPKPIIDDNLYPEPYGRSIQHDEKTKGPKPNLKSKLPVRNIKTPIQLQSSLKPTSKPKSGQPNCPRVNSPKTYSRPQQPTQYCIRETLNSTIPRPLHYQRPVSSCDSRPRGSVSTRSPSTNSNFSFRTTSNVKRPTRN